MSLRCSNAQAQRSFVAAKGAQMRPIIVRSAGRTRAVQVQAFFGAKSATPGSEFYTFQVKDIDGRNVKLDKYKGKVCLVVNTASACGFTPQLAEMQELHDTYSSKGLAILGFPCNQFGSQDPGSNNEIKRFASSNYGVKFPLFAKVDVNGKNADPLFDWLKSQKGGILNSDIKWNFSKFLLDRDGKVIGRYGSTTPPSQIEADIKKAL